MKESSQKIEVIETLNEKPKSWGVRHDLAVSSLGIFLITVSVLNIIVGISFSVAASFGVLFAAAWVSATRKNAHDFISKFIPLPGTSYFIEPVFFIPASETGSFKRKTQYKHKPKTVVVNNKKQELYPFHGESNLHALMEISIDSNVFTVYLNHDQKTGWSATIPFLLEGIHPEMLEEEAFTYSSELTRVLKDIPFGQDLTMMLGCRSKCDRRQQQLRELRDENKLPLVDLILSSESLKVKEITHKAERQQWSQYLYISWEQQTQHLRNNDGTLGAVINFLGNFIESKITKLTNTEDHRSYQIYSKIAEDIYKYSYSTWESILEKKGKLNISTLSVEQAWEHLWYKYNDSPVYTCPQVIKVAKVDREYICTLEIANKLNPKDAFSVLFENNNFPQHYQRRNSIAVNGELVATMVMKSPVKKFDYFREQLLYVWSRMSELKIRDTEIYVQFSSADKAKIDKSLKTITKQTGFRKKNAIATGNVIDIDASFKQNDAVEARARLHLGSDTLYAAVVLLVYRQTHDELAIACRQIEDIFSPAKFKRENEVCLDVWLETQIFNNRKMLTSSNTFTERRYIFDSISARGVLPIAKPQSIHDSGVEFITEEGGFPLHVNLTAANERMIILGESGSGKSVLAETFVTHAAAEGAKVAIVDMSAAGKSTFKVYVEQQGDDGAYINLVSDKRYNILQPPDLSRIDISMEDKKALLSVWKESLQTILLALCNPDARMYQSVSSIIPTLLKVFFNDLNITQRYNDAFEQGWKSEAWQRMPILRDLKFYCSLSKLNLEYSQQDEEAIAFINNQIESKLSDPNIGEAIGNVSNVPPTPSITMFALSGLSNDNNSYIMSLVAQMACLNVSLESLSSLIVFDETSELIEKPGFDIVLASNFTRGRKEGKAFLCILQELGSIVRSRVKKQIIENTNYWAIGNIRGSGSAQLYVDELGLPLQVVSQNRSKSFTLDRKRMCSRFLLKRSKQYYWHTLYYPSTISLAITANSQLEAAARDRVLSQFPQTHAGIKEGLAVFAKELYQTYSSGKSIKTIGVKENEKTVDLGHKSKYYVGNKFDR